MNIRPESIVVANNERFSFEIPETELTEALALVKVPDDFAEPTIRGFSILEITVRQAVRTVDGVNYRRVSFRHPVDPNSRVKSINLRQWKGHRRRAKERAKNLTPQPPLRSGEAGPEKS
jgi:hypothetical protein